MENRSGCPMYCTPMRALLNLTTIGSIVVVGILVAFMVDYLNKKKLVYKWNIWYTESVGGNNE